VELDDLIKKVGQNTKHDGSGKVAGMPQVLDGVISMFMVGFIVELFHELPADTTL